MESSHPPIPIDQQYLVALKSLAAKAIRRRQPVATPAAARQPLVGRPSDLAARDTWQAVHGV